MPRPSKDSRSTTTFGFRLPPEPRKKLLDLAEALAMPPGQLARLFTLQMLDASTTTEDIRDQVSHLQNEVSRLREDLTLARRELAVSTLAILQFGGKTPKEVAEKFASDNLIAAPKPG